MFNFLIWQKQKQNRAQKSYSVQLLSHDPLFVTPWNAACQASLCDTNSQSLLRLISIELVKPCKHLILCHSLLLLPSIFPSIRVFSNDSALRIRWPKYWSFSLNIIPSNEYSGLISFRMDWLALLAVQGTFKSLLQHHSSKESVLWCSAFFIVQLSHPYMTIGKTIALTRQPFVGKVMSLLLNMLSRLVITFLPRSKSLSISWLHSPSAVILEPPKIKSATVSPSIFPEVMGLGAMILVFWMLSFKPIILVIPNFMTKCGPLEKGMANHFSILTLRTPWTVWKGKKIGHWKMNSPGAQYATGDQGRNNSRIMKRQSQNKNNTQLWMWLGMEVKSNAVKNNIPRNLEC